MKLFSIINQGSGTVPADGQAQLTDALRALGAASHIVCVDGDGLRDAVDQAVSEAPDALIVWGGDGTVACGLNAVGGTGVPVLALPGGTMNLVHTRIHGELADWRDALQALVNISAPRPLVGGVVNGHRFYVAAMFGTLTELAVSREHLRHGELLGATKTFVGSDALDMNARLAWRPDASQPEKYASALAVVPPDTADEALTVARINPDSLIELTRTAMTAMIKGWEHADGVKQFKAERVHIQDREGQPVSGTVDGEPIDLPPQFYVERDGARALVLSAQL